MEKNNFRRRKIKLKRKELENQRIKSKIAKIALIILIISIILIIFSVIFALMNIDNENITRRNQSGKNR